MVHSMDSNVPHFLPSDNQFAREVVEGIWKSHWQRRDSTRW